MTPYCPFDFRLFWGMNLAMLTAQEDAGKNKEKIYLLLYYFQIKTRGKVVMWHMFYYKS